MSDILDFDATALALAYRNRRLSPVEVTQAMLEAIDRHNPAVNAFCIVAPEAALAAAQASEERFSRGAPLGPADGLPVTVKDNLAWAGHPTRRGSLASPTSAAEENSPAVDRLLESGAVPLGKTTLPEFGWKGLGDSPLTGITRNPWDTRQTTGGSSAGAAAAAALNLGTLHLGTDGAGSIRIPASFCGVYGLKPTYGRVPAHPPTPFAIVSHIGPITRSVRDAALMLSLIGQPDARDITAQGTAPPDDRIGLEDGVRGLRIAWSPRLGYVENLDHEVAEITQRAARAFEKLGATVEEADPPFSDPLSILEALWSAGAWSVVRTFPDEARARMDPGLLAMAERGRAVGGADFIMAANARGAPFAAMARFHERYDLLLTPAVATPAFEAGRDTPASGRFGSHWIDWAPYSFPFNLTLQPAASVPCGMTRSGLPVGLQIVGPARRDDLVLRASRAFETVRPWPRISQPRTGA